MDNQLDEPIELRGHHLSILAFCYWYKISLRDFSNFPNKNFNLMINDSKTDVEPYRPIFFRLLEKANTQIRIVHGLDSICLSCFLEKDEDCFGKNPDDEDSFTLEEYGLSCNEIYGTQILLEKIKRYPEKTEYQWKTPRYKWIDTRLI